MKHLTTDCIRRANDNDYNMMSELMKIQKEMWKDNNKGVISTREYLLNL